MKKNENVNTDNKRLIAKRRKQFLALVFGLVIGLLPTASVMAETVKIVNDVNVDSYVGKNIYNKSGEKLLWEVTSEAAFVTGHIKVFFDNPEHSCEEKETSKYNPKEFDINLNHYDSIANFDHWRIAECVADDDGDRYISVQLKPVTEAESGKVVVNAKPADGGKPEAGKANVYDGDKGISLSANPTEEFIFKEWEANENHVMIKNAKSADTTFDVVKVPDTGTIEITAVYEEKSGFTVTLDPQGGKCSKTSMTTGKNGKLTDIPTPTWDDKHQFIGWYDAPEGGKKVDSAYVFTKDATIYAQWKEGKPTPDPTKTPTPTPTPTPDPTPDPTPSPDEDDDDDEDETKPAPINPNAIGAFYYKNGILQTNVQIGKQEQSLLATAIFKASIPMGWNAAFSMSMSVNGKNETSKKDGTIVLYVPGEYQKPGRTFMILAMDKNGKVFELKDLDTNPNTVTVTPNIEGFAYYLIYKD